MVLFRHEAGKCLAFGVKVRPSAMCWWEKDGADVKLHLDVRCGTYGVELGGRKLEAAKIVMTSYALEEADTPVEVFEACRAFCSEMCDDPDCRDTVIYGGNNWYYAYGKSSAKEILEDSAYLAEMTEGIENRPFMVMDDGWQIDHSDSYNGGPWRVGNADYGDMGELAAQMRAKMCAPVSGSDRCTIILRIFRLSGDWSAMQRCSIFLCRRFWNISHRISDSLETGDMS